MAIVRNTIKFSSGGGSDITVVVNYGALPDPTTVSGQFYWCSASQGTSWLPGSLGGTYYNSGMYYSNGTTWEFVNVPYQATQSEVNAGTNTDKFVTPSTFANADKWLSVNTDATYKDTVKLAENITKGQAVYISSANGTNIVVSKASNSSESTSSKTIGLIETTGVTNDIVKVVTSGLLGGLNTSSATIGDSVWLGTSGNLIYGLVNKPVAPAHLVYIGVVTRVSATVGEILIKVQNGFELNEIHDVNPALTKAIPLNSDSLLLFDTVDNIWKKVLISDFKTTNFLDATSSIQGQLDVKIDKTSWIDYSATSTIVGLSTITDRIIFYKIVDNVMIVSFYIAGTSNGTTFNFTIPNTAASVSFSAGGLGFNNSIALTAPPRIQISNGSNVVNLFRDLSGATWTGSNAKAVGGQILIRL